MIGMAETLIFAMSQNIHSMDRLVIVLACALILSGCGSPEGAGVEAAEQYCACPNEDRWADMSISALEASIPPYLTEVRTGKLSDKQRIRSAFEQVKANAKRAAWDCRKKALEASRSRAKEFATNKEKSEQYQFAFDSKVATCEEEWKRLEKKNEAENGYKAISELYNKGYWIADSVDGAQKSAARANKARLENLGRDCSTPRSTVLELPESAAIAYRLMSGFGTTLAFGVRVTDVDVQVSPNRSQVGKIWFGAILNLSMVGFSREAKGFGVQIQTAKRESVVYFNNEMNAQKFLDATQSAISVWNDRCQELRR